jgi:hypothetical protein
MSIPKSRHDQLLSITLLCRFKVHLNKINDLAAKITRSPPFAVEDQSSLNLLIAIGFLACFLLDSKHSYAGQVDR